MKNKKWWYYLIPDHWFKKCEHPTCYYSEEESWDKVKGEMAVYDYTKKQFVSIEKAEKEGYNIHADIKRAAINRYYKGE